LIFKKIKYKMI